MFYVSVHQGVIQQVTDEGIALLGEVDLVFLRQTGVFPDGHGMESAHELEEVPHRGVVFLAQLQEGLFGQHAVGVDLVFVFLDLLLKNWTCIMNSLIRMDKGIFSKKRLIVMY